MTVVDIKVRIYPGGDPTNADTWPPGTDITDRVRYPGSDGGQAITYSGGRQDEAARVDASRMDMSLDNRDGRFSINNPLSPYYGKLRRGTPITLATTAFSDNFDRAASGTLGVGWSSSQFTVSANTARVTFATANGITRPLAVDSQAVNGEGRMTVWTDQYSAGTSFLIGALVRASDAVNNLMVRVEFNPFGQVDLRLGRVAANVSSIDATVLNLFTYVPTEKVRLRWMCDGGRFRAKAWKPANPALPDADEPAAWQISVASSFAPGARMGMFAWRLSGNTNTGQMGFAEDFSVEAYEFVGQIVQLPLAWDMSANNSWAALQAAGPLRRLQQGPGTLMSPLRRQLSGYKPIAYWPLEDGGGATQYGSAVAGVGAATAAYTTPAADSSLVGSLALPSFTAPGARITGQTSKRQVGALGFAAMFYVKLQQPTTKDTLLATFYGPGRVRRWRLLLQGAGPVNYRLEYYDGNGALIDYAVLSAPPVNYQEWTAWCLKTEYATGVVSWSLYTYQVGSDQYWQMVSGYVSPTPARCNAVSLGGSDLDGASWGHLWLGEYELPFVTNEFIRVSSGNAGEQAGARAARISAEGGTPLFLEAGASEPMGAQRPAAFLDTLRACEEGDYGVVYENGTGLGFRPRTARYSRPVLFTLSKAAGEIADAPKATEDDQAVRNSWTVNRDGGGAASARDEAHIAAEGLYEDSITLNLASDAPLPGHAAWRTFMGTRPGYRWPAISLDFLRSPRLLPAWRSLAYGHRFDIDLGANAQVPGIRPDLILEGWSAQLWPHGWKVTANCSPAQWWDIPLVVTSAADPAGGMVDSGGSTLGIALILRAPGAGDALGLSLPANEAWLPGISGFDLLINGEVMTVVAVAPWADNTQAVTVTRGTNGVTRAHPIGSAVSLAEPTYVAL